jgi:hypothetical protein
MKYRFEKVVEGISRYIDKEIYAGMNDFQEIVARIAVGRFIENQDRFKSTLTNNGIIQTFGVIDSEGLVDIDCLANDLKREIERKEKLTISIPMFGKLTFRGNDVDVIRQYITGERQ